MVSKEIYGILSVKMQVKYRRPGHEGTWYKVVQIHTERNVTLEQAAAVLMTWKEVNSEVIGEFRTVLF